MKPVRRGVLIVFLAALIAGLLIAASMQCARIRNRVSGDLADTDLDRDADGSLDAAAAPTLPALDPEKHCASLRAIAGYLDVVPSWRDDAGYLRNVDRDGGWLAFSRFGDDISGPTEIDDAGWGYRARGKEIPSGFTACEKGGTARVSSTSAISYSCTAGPAPDEATAAARFHELATIWRRCLGSSGLEQVRGSFEEGALTFRKPTPASRHIGCSVRLTSVMFELVCYNNQNN